MTCRYGRDDMSCSSHPANVAARYREEHETPPTPDSKNFFIECAVNIGPHLVLRVRYPNCKNCAYEGSKVMVYLNVSPIDALKWKKIDPHFRGEEPKDKEAPSPAARFPGSSDGWSDAVAYAESKTNEQDERPDGTAQNGRS